MPLSMFFLIGRILHVMLTNFLAFSRTAMRSRPVPTMRRAACSTSAQIASSTLSRTTTSYAVSRPLRSRFLDGYSLVVTTIGHATFGIPSGVNVWVSSLVMRTESAALGSVRMVWLCAREVGTARSG
jgi:hypothetical protein